MSATQKRAQTTLILASGSPRRRTLLALLGLPFTVQPSEVDEANHAGEGAAAMVSRLSQAKALALVAAASGGLAKRRGRRTPSAGSLIVAADTTVCLDGEVLGKPSDPDDAVKMLRRLRARAHVVYSSVTLLDAQTGWMRSELAESQVWMRDFSDEEIAAYVASGDPLDKAGSYAIQYAEFKPVERIVGCYANVMGFPLCHLYCMLRAAGPALAEVPVAACDRFNRRRCAVAEEIIGQVCERR